MNQARIIHNHETPEYYFEEQCHITEWLNSPDDPQASVVRARVMPGITTRWHRLEGITERYVIITGEGCIEVGELAPETLHTGDVVIIPPGTAQRITNTGQSELTFLAVCTPPFCPAAYEDIEELTV